MTVRSLVFVHAHPDDESLSTGGTIARYAAEGAHVCLITCTNGEVGEIADVPELGTADDIRPRLGEVRADELRAACQQLGTVDLRLLGYHDSGMDGTPENADPKAFVNQDMQTCVGKIVDVLLELRPQVLVTYNEIGLYGHPDHIQAHRAALRAVDAAAEGGHRVAKVYYTAVPKSLMRMGRELAETFGFERDDFFSEADIERIGTDDALITTSVDVAAYVEHKFKALLAHKTQLGTTETYLQIPEDMRTMALGTEHYVLARSGVGRPEGIEHDLFERVPV
jgi:N-acetyl-1-D-myo-inositol-2-amino-2-deoxy-alpha-D-glucopyranoside deacetylase